MSNFSPLKNKILNFTHKGKLVFKNILLIVSISSGTTIRLLKQSVLASG